MKTRNAYTTAIILVLGILVLLNFVSDEFFVRLDLTEDNRYTLSKATHDILKNLEEPVTVKAYFSEELPPDIARARREFKELLVEYSNLSGGNVVYEFISPNEDETKENEAMQEGIQPVVISVREKDEMKQQKAYLGAVIKKGDKKEVIPFVQPGGAVEYALSTSIKKISVSEKPSIGFLQGHGEPSTGMLFQANAALEVLYEVEEIQLNDTVPIPEKYKTIAIIAPKDSFPYTHLQRLDEFLARGGNLLIAINRVTADFQNLYGSAVNTGLESWLPGKGITVEESFIIDTRCGAVTVQQQQGFFRFATNVNFPFLPVIQKFADHPVTKGLEQVVLQFASPLAFSGDSSLKFSPLAFTSDKSGSQRAPLYMEIQKRWVETDFPVKNLPVAAVVQGRMGGDKQARLIVISDGDFAINGEQGKGQNLQPDNVSLLVNSIDWLSDDTGLIDLRTKGISARPLEQIEDGTKTLLKYTNFLSPIILIIVYGIFRMQIKRNQMVRRMQEKY
ncbi:MAG: GldG family protein [Bacteroidetes bacterium]|nr:GldG family protein [Bacteroidota bacterium]